MLEVKINDDKSVHIRSDGTSKEFISDAILAVIIMATSISESTGISVKESLDIMLTAAREVINDFNVEPVRSDTVTMPDPGEMFGKEGAGDDA